MIEFFPDRLERRRNFGVIHQPAQLRIAFARHNNFDAETVAVQAAAFVSLGQQRQQVRSFKLKRFSEFHFHDKFIFPNPSR